MGPTGCGKTTVGRGLADALGLPFLDADDLHPQANIDKMAAGIALDDDDRWDWLRDVAAWMADRPAGAVVACSALKASYRAVIRDIVPDVRIVYLAAPHEVLAERVARRQSAEGHFAPAALLAGQFRDLEPPLTSERHVVIDVSVRDADGAVADAVSWASAR
jgi:carbohydrate kinase (thermoresistant glucokinase family)